MIRSLREFDGMGRLDGEVALVTGGGRGIGAAIARHFAREGAAVAILEINPRSGAEVADAINAEGGRCVAFVGDVADRAGVEQAVAATAAAISAPSVLVNNAGISFRGDPLELPEEAWRRTFAVDLDGVWHATRAVLPGMLAAGRGSIVNIASVHAFKIVPHYFPYPVAKHAVIGLTRSIAIEYAARNIRCNAICPGAIETPGNVAIWNEHSDPDAERRRWEEIHPMKRIGSPEDVAAAAVFLASREAGFITGESLTIDGGRSILYHD
jgi:NAD(P)-dependent dehydrogenase (short-subunit alcohol dehydrogenase family)